MKAMQGCLPKVHVFGRSEDGVSFLFRGMKSGLILLSTLAAMLFGINDASAGTASCTGTPGVDVFTFPSPISIPRDNTAGSAPTALTPWVVGPADQNWWTCVSSDMPYVGVFHLPLLARTGMMFDDGGTNYTVFQTGTPGVGIVLSGRVFINGCGWNSGGWFDIGVRQGNGPSGYAGWSCNADGTWGEGGQLMMRLVKTGVISGGTLGALQPSQAVVGIDFSVVPSVAIKLFSTIPVNFEPLSCITPNISVTLPPVNKNEFATATDLKTTPFQFSLNNCPSGMTRIRYRIDPVNPVIDAANGVLAIDGGNGTAEGVSLRLTDRNDQPIRFQDETYVVGGYDANQGNSYLEIPLKVSYHRTSGNAADYVSIKPGEVRSAAQLTLYYE